MKAKDIIYIVIIIAVVSFFMNDCSRSAIIEDKKVSVSDTTWNITEKDTIIYNIIEKDTIIKKPKYVEVKKPINGRDDSLRTYTGTYLLDFGSIIWTANVSGYLEDISFRGRYEIPEKTKTKHHIGTVTKTVEITKTPRWNLYGGVQGTVSPIYYDIGPSVDLRLGKMKYGYNYGVVNKSHSINIQAVLF